MRDGKILPYLDIPLQHASPRILKLMKRPAPSSAPWSGSRSGADLPRITLRSTFIVGFPGETEEEFQMLLDFIDKAELDRVGCFKYSPVEGPRPTNCRIRCRPRCRKNASSASWNCNSRSPSASWPVKWAKRCWC